MKLGADRKAEFAENSDKLIDLIWRALIANQPVKRLPDL